MSEELEQLEGMAGHMNVRHEPAGSLSFFVPGVARPQGSMKPIVSKSTGKVFMKQSSTLHEWRAAVMTTASEAIVQYDWECVEEGPVVLSCDFRFVRPKSHTKKRRAEDGGIKDNGSDLDKLVRAVCDSLTYAGVYGDDRQVAWVSAAKRYVESAEDAGVEVTVMRLG